MTKNELIAALEKIPGNPQVVYQEGDIFYNIFGVEAHSLCNWPMVGGGYMLTTDHSPLFDDVDTVVLRNTTTPLK